MAECMKAISQDPTIEVLKMRDTKMRLREDYDAEALAGYRENADERVMPLRNLYDRTIFARLLPTHERAADS